jgi:KaiC/GvpD/RAD55 family RecA-like ATPase
MMIHTSTFQDLKAGKIDAMDVSPEQLLGWFQNPMRAASKQSLRLLALRRFGDLRSERGSLRHDANVISVTGLTGDYDAGKVSIDEAVALLKRESVRAMLFTSPSSTEARPRWRVLAPVSVECGPDEHLELMGKLNAVLGGILASESFTLSQAYFYGKADDAAHYETRDTLHMNRWIDQVDIEPVFPAARVSAQVPAHAAVAPDARLRTGEGRREALKSYIASVSARGLGKVEIDALVRVYVEQHFDSSDPVDWANVQGMVEWAAARDAASRVDVTRVSVLDEDAIAPLDLARVMAVDPPERRWVWDDWVPRGSVTSLYGAGGVGKSLISLQMAISVAAGQPMFGRQTTRGRVLCLYCEDDASELHLRMRRMAEQMGVDLLECSGLQVDARAGKKNVLVEADDVAAQVRVGRLFGRVDEMLAGGGYSLLVLDNIAQLMAVNENKRPIVTQAVNVLTQLAISRDVGILLLGHPAKGIGSQFSGSTAWDAAVRSRLMLERDETDEDRLILRKAKANYSQLDEMQLRYEGGAYIRTDGEHAGPVEVERVALARRAAERAVLTAIAELRSRNYDEWPTSSATSPRYLPKLMERHAMTQDIRQTDLARALGGLINLGKVRPTTEVNPATRKKFHSLVVM